jgi:hypothetical protein
MRPRGFARTRRAARARGLGKFFRTRFPRARPRPPRATVEPPPFAGLKGGVECEFTHKGSLSSVPFSTRSCHRHHMGHVSPDRKTSSFPDASISESRGERSETASRSNRRRPQLFVLFPTEGSVHLTDLVAYGGFHLPIPKVLTDSQRGKIIRHSPCSLTVLQTLRG